MNEVIWENMKQQLQMQTDLAGRAAKDENFRNNLRQHATKVFQQLGYEVAEGAEVKLVEDTSSVKHIVMPSNPNDAIEDESLASIAGGGSCLGCASSIGTVPSTIGSAGTASSNRPRRPAGVGIDTTTQIAEGAFQIGVQAGYDAAQDQQGGGA